VNATEVSDAGLEQIQGLSLALLDVGWTRVTCNGFGKFKGLEFGTVGSFSQPLTDASLEDLVGLAKLGGLRIVASGVTDNGLKPLERLAEAPFRDTRAGRLGNSLLLRFGRFLATVVRLLRPLRRASGSAAD
jgi:hypothetical protein